MHLVIPRDASELPRLPSDVIHIIMEIMLQQAEVNLDSDVNDPDVNGSDVDDPDIDDSDVDDSDVDDSNVDDSGVDLDSKMIDQLDFLSCCLVCRDWNEIALPFVTKCQVQSSNARRFAQLLTEAERIGLNHKSIFKEYTICLHKIIEVSEYNYNTDVGMFKMPPDTIKALQTILSTLPNLQKLAITTFFAIKYPDEMLHQFFTTIVESCHTQPHQLILELSRVPDHMCAELIRAFSTGLERLEIHHFYRQIDQGLASICRNLREVAFYHIERPVDISLLVPCWPALERFVLSQVLREPGDEPSNRIGLTPPIKSLAQSRLVASLTVNCRQLLEFKLYFDDSPIWNDGPSNRSLLKLFRQRQLVTLCIWKVLATTQPILRNLELANTAYVGGEYGDQLVSQWEDGWGWPVLETLNFEWLLVTQYFFNGVICGCGHLKHVIAPVMYRTF
ncbi:hypothetical protein BC937DRAFT_87815 [Endogone sp. FLAS-F59071]|nr:hypothetical protein BC937DRAFT_87815 [Endogone sp. FLAS-F59071]|eukprot:RUS22689.1 hypothetical protein BC937DRAFT_87815 [Endogone sp. FLAS-F59071]